MEVTVHKAKTNLSKLIEAALAGEEVIIAKGKTPVVKLVPVKKASFKIGILEGKLTGSGPNFFEPMTEEDLKLWEACE